jgi:hypothetical protein
MIERSPGFTPSETSKAPQTEPSYTNVIAQLLQARHPFKALTKICRDIPHFLPHEEAQQIFEKGDKGKIELIYHSLPTLLEALKNYYPWCGIGERDLFEVGFDTCWQAVHQWNPERRLNIGVRDPQKQPTTLPDSLRGFVSRRIHRRLQELIVRYYGLQRAHDFPVVKLFRQCWLDFVAVTGREPSLEEIEEWVRAENQERGLNLKLDFKKPGGERPVSKVATIYSAHNRPLTTVEAGEEFLQIEELALGRLLTEEMLNHLVVLKERERKVIFLYFGLGEEPPKTLREIGQILKIGDKRKVSDIKNRALGKLRQIVMSYLNFF